MHIFYLKLIPLIPFAANDVNEDDSIKDLVKNTFTLRNSDDIITSIKIMLNYTIVSDEIDIDKANLVNTILHNSNTNEIDYRNLKKIDNASNITVNNNKFLINITPTTDNTKKHEFKFRFPIFLKDINDFFRKIDIINFDEFDVRLTYKNPFIFKRPNSTFTIISADLYINELTLSKSDKVKFLKMLNTGFLKKINYVENNIRIFTDIKNGKENI